MKPIVRKTLLFAHITTSVAWLGAIIPYLAIAIMGLRATDVGVLDSSLHSMVLLGTYILIPLSLAAFISGIVISLATPWGLIRYWWISTKLILTALLWLSS